MAFCCLRHYLRYSYISLRPLSYLEIAQKCLQFSTSEKMSSKNNDSIPVKFTASKGAKVSIGETIGIEEKTSNQNKSKYEKFVIFASIVAFFLYFCVIREENDIDEILKGNMKDEKNNYVELLNLKLMLNYCQKNHLPTNAIKARIEELEMNNLIRSSFKK